MKKNTFVLSKRLQALPPYLFLELDKAKRKARSEGRDIIDLGIGDPDEPTPDYIIRALYKAALEPVNHRYALDQGMLIFRQAISKWYKSRFNVTLESDTEILPLIGSKEGIAHFPLAFINPGDYSLVPDPSYPPYKGGTIFAEGKIHLMPLLEQNDFLIDLKAIPAGVLKKAKVIYINYPNNPTGAVCDINFYKELVKFARKNKIIVVCDLAYSEMSYDGFKPPSFFEVEGAKEVGIEFHSLSKTCNMTGWRIGWACGNKNLVAALAKVKSNIDSGIFSALQVAAVAALEGSAVQTKRMSQVYQERRDCLVDGLNSLGWKVKKPKATFYIWSKLPKKISSIDFSRELLAKADIVATPGVGFGKYGEGYIRFALTVPKERIKEAIKRLKKI
ncbi:MAG: LL-diaminopimelate aminotransferase [Candidatus Omnitrophota bacterium]|nr:LL-diaminopimelate aminotransferase [Candidatus Omnitrophota bacterium]MBU1928545.1 LL-diaminopimelate aminotransferase [Candidatus Omnitrophota bacterium]MBU2034905.1 LL-diaminopimelate aminotransferase [Candidatus Omnitrophota bacterium]MBU2221363.1 LL-diaminopimelate aminotransferase [Candidatus Omnitrophota bacterium]MBU2258828.1 LL-diaminopimelate aminotransferase [Candidatus Omnitrophota bacterium]